MALKFYDSPFHVNHNNDVANEMVKKVDFGHSAQVVGCILR